MADHPGFFERAGPFTLEQIAKTVGASLAEGADGSLAISDVRPLRDAQTSHLAYFENRRYIDQLKLTAASACIVSPGNLKHVPATSASLSSKEPYEAFAGVIRLFYPASMRSRAADSAADGRGGMVHPSAKLGEGVTIEPGAVVGREAVIGSGSTVTANAVVGYRVVLGSDCYIGAGATVTHAILGDGVIVHAGARIGQDGFGFAMSARGHLKVPQIGSVIIGDNVEIGSNTTIDRGTLTSTVIGAGTKIDNLVQIGHNVVIGSNCVIVAQSGIAGSARLGDFVVMGAQSGILGHVEVGMGAQIAGMAHVKDDVPPHSRMGGTPARPFKEWAREIAAVRLLGLQRSKPGSGEV